MNWIQTMFLAIVQGITEFLPISSSGHLLVIQDLYATLGTQVKEDPLTWTIALHVGTLFSVFVVFWKRIVSLLTSDKRVIPLLIVATIPAVMAALGMKVLHADAVLKNSLLAGFCFPITGLMLLFGFEKSGEKTCRDLSWKDAAIIGLVQAVAILPGISRSGSTICAGLFCRLKRDEAAAFSFLMAIPAIGGAALLETMKLLKEMKNGTESLGGSHNLVMLGIGALLSFVVGVIALKLLIQWLQQGKLKYFAWWLFIIGPIVIFWRLCVVLLAG